MLIVCPNCATSYDIDVASLRPDGRKVRCVRCRTVWNAEIPHNEKLLAAAEALAPGREPDDATLAATAEPIVPLPAGADEAGFDGVVAAETPAEQPAVEETDGSLPPAEGSAIADDFDAAEEDSAVEVESPPTAPEDSTYPIDIEAEPAASHDEPPEDIESIAARRYPRPGKRVRWQWPLSRLQSAIVTLIVIDAIVIGWRGDFVRAMPQTASFYAWLGLPVNVRGLDFDDLTTSTEQHDGVPILVVGGKILNATGKTESVEHLRFAVRNAARQEIYSWSAAPPQSVVAPGQAVAFQTRLASPPPDSHDVLVRFVNRYDILTGAH